MSPRTKTSIINLAAVGGAIVTVASAAWGGGSGAMLIADHRYVSRDTFVAYRTGDSTRHIVDSLNLRDALTELRQHQDSIVGVLKVCIRHPEDCR